MVNNVTEEYVGKKIKAPSEWRWWLQEPSLIHESVFAWTAAIEEDQSLRKTWNLKYLRLYMNREISGVSTHTYSSASNTSMLNRVTYNVVKSCTDSIASKISKNKPRPFFLTTKGDYSLKRKAKKLTQYVDGSFDAAKAYDKGQQIFTDSCIWGTGVLKVYPCTTSGEVKIDRVLIDELIIDDRESMYGEMKQMHQKRAVSRDVLQAQYPEHHDKLLMTSPTKSDDNHAVTDMVTVIESWHLASGPNAGDGKHVICVDNVVLFEEEYTKTEFPFVFFKWTDAVLGFYGSGLAEELIGIQVEINKMLQQIQKAQHLISVPRVFMSGDSKVISQHLQNQIGSIIKYQGGKPPVFHTPTAMQPEYYKHLERLYQRAFEITGISLMSATSQKPTGLNSGEALRAYDDIESERFMVTGQRWEAFYLELAEKFISCSKELYENDKKLKVKVAGKKFIDTIKWKDVDMDEDKYSLRIFPTSLLPTHPSGRLSKIQELYQGGFLTKEQALALFDFPDVEGVTNVQLAALEEIEMSIELMIDEGKYISPEPETNLELAKIMSHNAYLRGKLDGVPPKNLELLQRYRTRCNELIDLAAPPPVPQPMPQAAVPEALPTSDIIPNVPGEPV
jgi:hypothetical protein